MRAVFVQAKKPFVLYVEFEDGLKGESSFDDCIVGPVFEPLREESFFNKVQIDEFGVVCWPNGADLAPELLYERIRNKSLGAKKKVQA